MNSANGSRKQFDMWEGHKQTDEAKPEKKKEISIKKSTILDFYNFI